MAYYANQKTITINKPQCDRDDVKVILKRETIEAAARNLTGNEFKLYIYFASNSDGYKLDFSPKYFESIYGITAETTRKLVKQLEEKGYLVQKEKSNLFDFFLEPHKQLDIIYEEEKRLVPTKSGYIPATFREISQSLVDRTKEEIQSYWDKLDVYKGEN